MSSISEKVSTVNQFVLFLSIIGYIAAEYYAPREMVGKSFHAVLIIGILFLGSVGYAILQELKKLNAKKSDARLPPHDCD